MEIENGKLSIESIFEEGRRFEIPDYQRSYAWSEKQLKDFLNDFSAAENHKKYYYGTILLQKKEGLPTETYEIVDGQQRITTLVIFIYCLINKMKQEKIGSTTIESLSKKYICDHNNNPILKLQKQDNNFFKSYILSESNDPSIATPAQKNLLEAKNFFIRNLENCTKEDLEGYMERISSANCLIYSVSDRGEAAMIFETTNDRGKLLTNLEKTKSFLMYKVSTVLTNYDSTLDTIQEIFNEIFIKYENLREKEKFNISESSIQQYSFIAFEGWKNKKISGQKSYKAYQHYLEELKEKVNKMILDINLAVDEKEKNIKSNELNEYINNYIHNLQNSFTAIEHMFNNRYKEFFKLLALDRMASIYPLLIKAHYSDETPNKGNFCELCHLCEIFCFRGLTIMKYLSNKYQDKFFSMARDFKGDFKNLFKEIKTLIISLGDNKKFLKKLENEEFFKEYSSQDRNYFFWSYENYLRNQKGKNYPNLTFEHLWEKDTKKKLTIEHIIAQANEKDKFRILKDDKFVKIGQRKKFDKEYLHSIGNLTIDPKSANSAKGKNDFEDKNSEFFKYAPLMSQLELDNFLENKKWTLNSIIKRKNKLLDFAKNTWCFNEEEVTPIIVDESNDDLEDTNEIE